jgi:hypothetical protein
VAQLSTLGVNMPSPDSDIFAGLAPHQWHDLKNIVLLASQGEVRPIPLAVRWHPASKAVLEFRETGDHKYLDAAARELCPLYPEKAWLALEKS